MADAQTQLQRELVLQLFQRGWASLPWSPEAEQLLERIRFWKNSGEEWSEQNLQASCGEWLFPHADLTAQNLFSEKTLQEALLSRLGWNEAQKLETAVPSHLIVPSGSRKKLFYHGGAAPVLEVRIQEVFGWTQTPLVCGQAVVIHLLSPAQRPLQITRDLKSFWENTYSEIRKEMRGRYPKHYWPEDPTQAEPTSRIRPRPAT